MNDCMIPDRVEARRVIVQQYGDLHIRFRQNRKIKRTKFKQIVGCGDR